MSFHPVKNENCGYSKFLLLHTGDNCASSSSTSSPSSIPSSILLSNSSRVCRPPRALPDEDTDDKRPKKKYLKFSILFLFFKPRPPCAKALFQLQGLPPSTLIRHENRAFRKRSSSLRNAFRKRWRYDNIEFPCPSFQQTHPKRPVIASFSISPGYNGQKTFYTFSEWQRYFRISPAYLGGGLKKHEDFLNPS